MNWQRFFSIYNVFFFQYRARKKNHCSCSRIFLFGCKIIFFFCHCIKYLYNNFIISLYKNFFCVLHHTRGVVNKIVVKSMTCYGPSNTKPCCEWSAIVSESCAIVRAPSDRVGSVSIQSMLSSAEVANLVDMLTTVASSRTAGARFGLGRGSL